MTRNGEQHCSDITQVLAHGGMGYAQEYHVERYFRECLVPRIAPVSRVSILGTISYSEFLELTMSSRK